MTGPGALPLVAWLERAAAEVERAALEPLVAVVPGAEVTREPHGSVVVRAGGRRVAEFDRRGTLLAALRWAESTLVRAWLRVPVGGWLLLAPRATHAAPWGVADALALAARAGGEARPAGALEPLDWAQPDRIPTLADPAGLPPGAGTVLLNLLAALARDAGRRALAYHGPYPGEQLFLALLEAFRYEPADVVDPLAAFVAGRLRWTPAPFERLHTPDGVWVHLRDGVEKVHWRGRTYYRVDWQGLARHAPRRVRSEAGRVVCSLWALGEALEDHLLLTPAGDVLAALPPAPPPPIEAPLPPAVARALGAVVAAGSAPALAPFVRAVAGELRYAWAPVVGDLVERAGDRVRFSSRLAARLAARAAALAGAARAALGLQALVELAHLVGDDLRALARERVAALDPAAQAAALGAPPPPDPDAARAITQGVEALLASLPTPCAAGA